MDLKSGYPWWAVKNGLLHAFPPLQLDLRCDVAVLGGGISGALIADELGAHGHEVVVIEDDADLVARSRANGFLSIRGNAANPRVMDEAAPGRASMAVFAIPQALEAGETIARLKAINPSITVLARAHSDGQVKHLLEHGADAAVLAERELAYSLAEMVMATPPFLSARIQPTSAA